MPDNDNTFDLSGLELGKPTEYHSTYTANLLQAVPRSTNREELGIAKHQPFFGEDVWHAYELSWLNGKGKPVVALMRCSVSCSSHSLIESKSFKLYLNSFNQSRFEGIKQVRDCLVKDLSLVAGDDVCVELFRPVDRAEFAVTELPGISLDTQDIEINTYDLEPSILSQASAVSAECIHETVHSHLLKSNCLITNQPDWASVIISYSGPAISHEALLRYLISFRMHNEFHEQCVERIFVDLMNAFSCESLSVYALYTRRGGLDINPYRTTERNTTAAQLRINRQ